MHSVKAHTICCSGGGYKLANKESSFVSFVRGVGMSTCVRQLSAAMRAAARSSRTNRGSIRAHTHSTSGRRASELPKHLEHNEVEHRLYSWWESSGFFRYVPLPLYLVLWPLSSTTGSHNLNAWLSCRPEAAGSNAKPFVVQMPPPNVTGALHMGHALCVALEDSLIRHRRMEGNATLYLPGTDHAGIATQQVVERELNNEGSSRFELGREVFEERVWEWKQMYGRRITSQLRSLGASCDWSREVFTLDTQMSSAVTEAFVRLHEGGLVYRGEYMVNWSPSLRTALSDLEVELSEESGTLFHLQYPSKPNGAGESEWTFLPVATSRPETILGDTALAVNPQDERYSSFVGGEAAVPLTGGRRIPIIADDGVDTEFGTGCLKVTPAHDKNDHALGKKHSLETLRVIDGTGSIQLQGSEFDGLDRYSCREKLWQALKDVSVASHEEEYTTRVPRSQRSGEVIEPLVSMQWFVEMGEIAQEAAGAVRNGELSIVPSRFERTWFDWLDNIEDWCVSRQLWWGHRIPAWYVQDNKGREDGSYIVARSAEEARHEARQRFGDSIRLRQEEDVLDTWFSSSLWPFSTVGWPSSDAQDLQRFYPAAVLETGHDILFFWVARMVMMGKKLTSQLPFHTIFLHGIVRDGSGKKMSKSLGNTLDPLQTINEIGADALRFTLASGTSPGYDLNLSNDKLSGSRNFANKVFNLGKYVLSVLDDMEDSEQRRLAETEANFASDQALQRLPLHERWIVSALHATANAANESMRTLELADAARRIYDFIYDDLADWFVEASKADVYGSNAEAMQRSKAVLLYCLESSLRLLHPFMPYVTEEVWQSIPHVGRTIMFARYPGASERLPLDEDASAEFQAVRLLVRLVRNVRADYGVQPGKRVPCTVHASDADGKLHNAMQSSLYLMDALCKVDTAQSEVSSRAADRSDEDTVQAVVQDGLEVSLPLTDLADPEKEVERLQKQEAKLQKELEKAEATLNKDSFVQKAPESVVNKTREEARQAREQLGSVQDRMERMKQLQSVTARK